MASKEVQLLQKKPNYVNSVTSIFLTALDSCVYLIGIYEAAE